MSPVKDAVYYYSQAVKKLNSWSVHETQAIVSLLKKTVEIDPQFYKARVLLCNCYSWMSALNQISQEVATEEINNNLAILKEAEHNTPEYYTLLGKRNFWVEWNITTAIRNCNRALELNPTYPEALILKGLLSLAKGKKQNALRSLLKAERFEPLGNNINYFVSLTFFYSGEMEKALLYINRNIRISPHWHQQYYEKTAILAALGQVTEIEQLISFVKKSESVSKQFLSVLQAHYLVAKGDVHSARTVMENTANTLDQSVEKMHPYYSYLADLSIVLGDRKEALQFLRKGIQCKSTPLTFFHSNFLWDDFRTLPEFKEITENVFYAAQTKSSRYHKSEISPEKALLLTEKLEEIMCTEKPWLDSDLNRLQLAKQLGVSSHQFSQLLNSHIGSTFYDYCNSFRLNHFLKISDLKEYSNTTILYRALESGFRSKTTFNTFFKKQIGTTPSAHVKR